MRELKTYELLDAVKNVLKDNASISTFCISNYGHAHKVFIGINDEDPPSSDDYPAIVIFYSKRNKSSNTSIVVRAIEFGVCVKDNDIVLDGNTTVLMGAIRAAQLRELVESALVTSHLAKVDADGESISDYQFPLFSENTIIEFEWPKSYSRPAR